LSMQALPIAGIRLGVAQAGIKYSGRDDLTLIEIAQGSTTAAVFTQNAFRAAPVTVAERNNAAQDARYLLINSGNANAGTGLPGMMACEQTCVDVARLTESDARRVLPFSTGVIGELLDPGTLAAALPSAITNLDEGNWERAARAIMTTDTRPKMRTQRVEVGGWSCCLTGMSKGSGMIQPNMATMLGFIATDAVIPASMLDGMLRAAVNLSFNRITVDGDTSTNDAVTLSATGQSDFVVSPTAPEEALAFQAALNELAIALAQDIIRDGEGATKFVEIEVLDARSVDEADRVARTIAHSPLVKTALFASDPNWGRILAAVGRAGVEDLDVDTVSLSLNGVLIAEKGARAQNYTEQAGVAAMAPEDLLISVNLARGNQAATIWTTDFSYDYVKINAEYRT
jgi:glutamate N-acetyltransferase/amino-acid N-acetyltransferase